MFSVDLRTRECDGYVVVALRGELDLVDAADLAAALAAAVAREPRADGAVLNRHRKLMPTNPERMVWGQGDASGLRVTDTAAGQLGSLICWENYMPLARYALYAGGVETYVAATWDEGDTWIATMRHIAEEGRCWVIGAGCSLRAGDVPAGFPGRGQLFPDPDEWLNPGDSVVVAPGGQVVAGPLHQEHGLLFADIEPGRVAAAHRTLDVAGPLQPP
jgi:nitrilase